MSLLRVKTTECRVGIIGLSNAGKTVLLTSLIDHLQHHDEDRFRIGHHASLRKFRIEPIDKGWVKFNYEQYRDALVHRGRWPRKTRDRSQFVCSFERSDWRYRDALLKLYDLPGERLADAAMMDRDYSAWSDATLTRIEHDTPSREVAVEFLNELQHPQPDAARLIHAYKLALARNILQYRPIVSPSTFLLDIHGSVARNESAETLATQRIVGLSVDQQFVPLSHHVRHDHPELARQFLEAYHAYRGQAIEPFLEALRSCHALIVLTDVTTLLSAGVGMYNENYQILSELFRILDPGESPIEAFGRHLADIFLPHELRPRWINRIAFVTPKMDLIHPIDRDRALNLSRRLVKTLAKDRDGLKYEFFNCAAVVSTKPLSGTPNQRLLAGLPYRNADGEKIATPTEQRFEVSPLPDDWPLDWQAGEYHFPDVYPTIPARKDYPPEQLNLDRIFNFVMEGKRT